MQRPAFKSQNSEFFQDYQLSNNRFRKSKEDPIAKFFLEVPVCHSIDIRFLLSSINFLSVEIMFCNKENRHLINSHKNPGTDMSRKAVQESY